MLISYQVKFDESRREVLKMGRCCCCCRSRGSQEEPEDEIGDGGGGGCCCCGRRGASIIFSLLGLLFAAAVITGPVYVYNHDQVRIVIGQEKRGNVSK